MGFATQMECRDSDCLYLLEIHVLRGWREQGLGTRLLNIIKQHACAHKGRLSLTAMDSNDIAIRWYLRQGFVPQLKSAEMYTIFDWNDEVQTTSAAQYAEEVGDYVRQNSLRLSPIENRYMSSSEALVQLQLELCRTSGFKLNCLAFSVMIVSKAIGSTRMDQVGAQARSDLERRLTHEVILERLPSAAETESGGNDVWWAGNTRASLKRIFENSDCMNEAHVHGFSNRLEQTIVTIDVRKPAVVLTKYVPGYEVARQMSMREAKALRQSSAECAKPPIWLLMTTNHFSALLVLDFNR